MSDFDLNTTLGRDVQRYNSALNGYQRKLNDFESGITDVRPVPPRDPLKGQTEARIGEALDYQGNADFVRDAPGMIARVLRRKTDG